MKSIRDLALVLFALLVLPLAAQIPNDPVAWLKADGNALDATANGNHGVVNGTVPFVAGKVGSAFSFTGNGANSVRIPNSASLQSSLLSVEYWIFFNNAQNSVNVTKRSSTGAGDAWQVGISYSGGNFNLQFVGYTASGLFDWYSPPLSSPVGVWTHVAATYDGSTVRGYINGTQVLTLAVALQLGSRNSDIFVGAYPTGIFALDGKIDELSIYNRALSAAEVQAVYQAGPAGKAGFPAPTVTGVSPSSGSTLGGTNVTITGTNFTGATAVTIGGSVAANVTVVNATTITATTPAGAAGPASVVVATPGGSNAANTLFTYVAPAPTVTEVTPSSGSTAGGTAVTITGTNFTGATAVTIGGSMASNVTVVNATTITATTPPRSAGPASVVVATPGGSNAANTLFTYVAPAPTVTGVTPSSGSTAGGTAVTITGTNFTGATAVTIGGSAASNVTVVNASTITATTPAGAAGPAGVVVTTPGGSNAANTLFTFGTPNVAPDFSLPDALTSWIPRESSRNWRDIASSADGSKLAAVVFGGQIHTSTDGGVSWTPRESSRAWFSIASSADGSKLAAVAGSGEVYTSTDGGVSWTPRTVAAGFAFSFTSIASSADGSKLAASESGGRIYTSTDGGASWTARESSRNWFAITSSADGSKLAAVVLGGQIHTSTDSGISWTPRQSVRDWSAIASSADGNKLVATTNGQGYVYTSTDGGVSWTQRNGPLNWRSVASSADGSRLAAMEGGGMIHLTTDGGVNWTPRANNPSWYAITSSADGRKLAAVAYGGRIFTSPPYNLTVEANSGPSTTVNFVTAISPGPVAEAGQTVSLEVSNDNNGIFATQPAIAGNGTLTFTPNNTGGVATVTVIARDDGGTDFGGSDASVPQSFTISVKPTVTGVSPASGSTSGGTSVTITGAGFTRATGVTFRGLPATAFTVVDATTITATTAATSAGVASVIVTTPAGSSAPNSLYTFVIPVPTVAGVSPSRGIVSGGTSITITGADFTNAYGVLVGGVSATAFSVVNDTTITATTPPKEAWMPSNVSVVVITAGGASAANSLFTYVTPNAAPSFDLPSSHTAGDSWTARESNRIWECIASSADGLKLAAVVYGGHIYTSENGGIDWTARMTDANRNWHSIASSADGSKLVAGAFPGKVYTSTDGGVTWTERGFDQSWISIASSADGNKLAAVGPGGRIMTSIDGGINWTARMTDAFRSWQSIASSADGSKLAAVVEGGQIYTSTDSGVNWTPGASNGQWRAIASSADGNKLAAVAYDGTIATSDNGGLIWTTRMGLYGWRSITSSADGSKLTAVAQFHFISTSINSGATWTTRMTDNYRNWRYVASSADGDRLAAVATSGQIYTSPIYNVAVAVNTGLSTTVSFATNISPGPLADAGQAVSFNVTNDNPGLFTIQPAISSNGTLTFAPGSTTGTVKVTVSATDNGGNEFGGTDTGYPKFFTITLLPPPLEMWRQTHFGSVANSGNGADGSDFDRDGLVNLLEYGLVLSPVTSSSAPSATVATYPEGKRLRMFLSRDPARYDVTLEVQAGDDLVGWTTIATSALGAPFSGPGYVGGDSATPGVKTVEVRDVLNITSSPRRFLRVLVR